MCGIVGIVGTTPVNQSIYDVLTVLYSNHLMKLT
jgi:amidophosphoribosyltransferase